MLVHGGLAIVMGWLVDRSGPSRIMVFCGALIGLGLVLTSQITELWQLYVTYGIIVGSGVSGGFVTVTATTARWFTRRRGLALGIVSSGIGLGTMILVPLSARLITAYGWSTTYFIFGVAASVLIIPSALLLRRDAGAKQLMASGKIEPTSNVTAGDGEKAEHTALESGLTLKVAIRHRPMWMIFSIFFLFIFCLQMVMAHLVNYATDMGTAPFIAATFISIIGTSSIAGRMLMGAAADKIGSTNALLICCIILSATLLLLIFSRELWTFYLFAIAFGFAYGGEIPQIPALVSRFFGLRAVAALVGFVLLGSNIGGAIGAWAAGQIFDVTLSYQVAFMIAIIVSFFAAIMTLRLKKVQTIVSD